ncbi:MAG: Methyltransferase type 11 [Parcubacteria group bacterium GW2011_GWF2_45_11]|nr:MAG: Methyltransferase type 11 [Parcubacteria group bacterium GW2011_GWF2_45_11]
MSTPISNAAGNDSFRALKEAWHCPVCGSEARTTVLSSFYCFEGDHFDLSRCAGCRLIHVAPMPSDEIIQRMYGDRYFQEDFISSRYEGSYSDIFNKRRAEFEEVLGNIERHIPAAHRSLFEVGSAGGAFLQCAKMRGWNVSGLEISAWGVQNAQKLYGISLTRGNFLNTELPERAYPVMFFGDVFEHFVNPLTAIEKINRSLIPGGYVAMLLPMYISSWTFRVFIALRPILKKLNLPQNFKVLLKLETKDSSFNPPYHVYEYSRKTVRRLLENSGFKVLAIKGNLPIPESLAHAQGGESLTRMVLRQAALWVYKMIKFSTENFNFPLVRSLVIAQKIEKSK